LTIPNVGPFTAAGTMAQMAVGAAAITGARAGGIAGALQTHGVNIVDAGYYKRELKDWPRTGSD